MTATALKIDIPAPTLFAEDCPVTKAVEALASAPAEARGAIFTKAEVVAFILDLVGYTSDQDLSARRILEPSFGGGGFLLEIVSRLLSSAKANGKPADQLVDCIRGVEIHRDTFQSTRGSVLQRLQDHGVKDAAAAKLVDAWLLPGDFLLAPIDGRFDVVVGNPPYLRQEMIAPPLIDAYRARYKTIFDRADLYIPFFERSLGLLCENGKLGFICADRWMKNRYGAPLRRYVSDKYSLDVHVDMTGVDAFRSDVVAYPAISVLSRGGAGPTRITAKPDLDTDNLGRLTKALTGEIEAEDVQARDGVVAGDAPWILETSRELDLVARLEARFPTLEEVGCKVGIGVATGADKVFIGPFDQLDVEDERKLPLAMTKDIKGGDVEWRGLGIVNPFEVDGSLASFERYPRFAAFLNANKDAIARRHVAKKTPERWYRTIDRIYPELTRAPKLLIPDIKGDAQIVYEGGELYPHHNLYFITAEDWDLRALQAVLSGGIARLFVAAYSTRMRGGYLRFQAQYLRRIRIPQWADVAEGVHEDLLSDDEAIVIDALGRLYELSPDELGLFQEGLADAA